MSNTKAKIAAIRRLLETGKATQAEAETRRALRGSPNDPDLNAAMGVVLGSRGEIEHALYFMQRALDVRPNEPTLLTNVGMLLGKLNRPDEAVPPLLRAAALNPRSSEPHLGLASAYRARHEYTAAAEELELGLALNPDDPALAALYASVLSNLARAPESVRFARDWLSRHSDSSTAGMLAHAANYDPTLSPREAFECHAAFGRTIEAPPPAAHTNTRDLVRPLRVGILSNDMRQHSVAYFLESILDHVDPARIDLVCYSTSPHEDEVTARFKPLAGTWRAVAHLDDADLARQIRADRIDILIETSGLTRGHRLGVMALKPAPVQATYCGYPATSGLGAIDYRIVDTITDPPGAEPWQTERLCRLDGCFLSYSPPRESPPVWDRRPGRGITFGSFNAAMKLNDAVIATWARVLAATPGSRLILKAAEFQDARLRAQIATRFEHAGVETARLSVLAPTPSVTEHLIAYGQIDVALDPFPYNGTTTTCEALWMGVPVVTLAGRVHAARVGMSLLRAAGVPELIAPDEDAYVAIAAALARDTTRLADLRSGLRGRLEASALLDRAAYRERFYAALREMWREWCASNAGAVA